MYVISEASSCTIKIKFYTFYVGKIFIDSSHDCEALVLYWADRLHLGQLANETEVTKYKYRYTIYYCVYFSIENRL